ncbi:FAS1-like dehydratase domain-containing protein [Streptacidiphilus sp. PAMC 29251]
MNPDAAGTTGAPFTHDVERGKIREFARATGARRPHPWEGEAPVIPPTFLTTRFFWAEGDAQVWDALDFNWKRGLHAEQEYVFHGPPPQAGTRLTGRTRIAEVYQKEGRRGGAMSFAVLVTEFHDESGRLVAEDRMTVVETGKPPAQEPQ